MQHHGPVCPGPLRLRAAAPLLLLALCACARGGLPSRPDVTPRLSAQAAEAAASQAALQDPAAGPALSGEEQIDHILSRATFGARPGDRARVQQLGISAFLEEQLHPEGLDDAKAGKQLEGLLVLTRSPAELTQELTGYRKSQQQKREDEERQRRAQAALEGEKKRDAGEQLVAGTLPRGPLTADEAARHNQLVNEASEVAAAVAGPGPITAADAARLQRLQALGGARPIESEPPRAEKAKPPARPGQAQLRKVMGKAGRGPGFDYTLELAEAKLVRAVASERQLYEVMADFWFNHFNVFAGKDEESALLPGYERDVIRPNTLGSFPELLTATAHSPAMLIYLDNWRSTAPEGAETGARRFAVARDGRLVAARTGKKPRKAAGLNENYARELLELHTLGVDGGYTQKDVTEVARCFTGWTVAEPKQNPRFVFQPELHDDGPKDVLGMHLDPGGGQEDGERVLALLARQPSTARFVARKLVRRFVADDAPDALVDRVAQVYTRTQGDVRGMLREIFESPELWSRRALKAKMRSPLELVAASIRSLGAKVDEPWQLARAVARIGQPLYAAQPPTGYPDTQAGWASSGALLARIDFGLQLAMGQLDGVQVDLTTLAWGAKSADEVLLRAAQRLGAGEVSDATRAYILGQLRELRPDQVQRRPELVAQRAVGLLLGAPELQRR